MAEAPAELAEATRFVPKLRSSGDLLVLHMGICPEVVAANFETSVVRTP